MPPIVIATRIMIPLELFKVIVDLLIGRDWQPTVAQRLETISSSMDED
jgi:hypothetical protein